MRAKRIILAFALSTVLALSSCTPKVNTTPFTESARANDDIATSIKLLIITENNLETQKQITAREGLLVVNGLMALHGANVQFNTDLTAAERSGDKSALKASLDALKKAVNDLNTNGVLGIKSDQARQVFSLTMGTISLSLGVLEGFVTSP